MEINIAVARKVLEVVDAGLVRGVGEPKPGQMCVEAAVCYALGLPHGDDPQCVSHALRSLKIALNDKAWSSDAARGQGLRRLALAQLGSRDHLDDVEFTKRVTTMTIRVLVPLALRVAADKHPDDKHKITMRAAADECERNPVKAAANAAANAADTAADAAAYTAAYAADTAANAADTAANAADAAAYAADAAANAAAYAAAYAANAAAYAAAYAAYAARDKVLDQFAEEVVQILIEMKAPGCQWLSLTEA